MRTSPTVPNLGALLLQRRFSFRKNGKARSVTFRVGQPFRDPRGDWGISFQVEGLGPGKVIQPGRRCPSRLADPGDRKSTRLNSSHLVISYAVFCLKKKKNNTTHANNY